MTVTKIDLNNFLNELNEVHYEIEILLYNVAKDSNQSILSPKEAYLLKDLAYKIQETLEKFPTEEELLKE